MTTYSFHYGAEDVRFDIPDTYSVDVYQPKQTPPHPHPLDAVNHALANPCGVVPDLRGFRSAAIAVNDKTRPVPHEYLLPPLLKHLEDAGISSNRITLIVASGTHIPMQPEEYPKILPREIIERYPVISHNSKDDSNLEVLGTTSRGTPVRINKKYLDADLRIVVGNIEPHHFMGYSGGVKSAVIGLGAQETINSNHSFLTDPYARTGEYEQNPMRQDIEEIGKMIGVHLAVNAILNQSKEIVTVFAGEPIEVMKEGIRKVKDTCQVHIPHKYDLVIASAGGQPKDINFYQSQKALTHAAMITRDGGDVILAAACPDGVGCDPYESWIEGITSHAEVLHRFKAEPFRLGPHKAYMVARDASHMHIRIVSHMDPHLVEKLMLTPSSSVEEAVRQALLSLPSGGTIAILPSAVSTMPLIG